MGMRPSSDQGSPQRGQCISMVQIQRPSASRTSPEVNHDHDAPIQQESHRCSNTCRGPVPYPYPRGTVEQVARQLLDPAPRAPAPMLATLRAAPVRGDNLATEWKWDGQRATVIVSGTDVRVLSRNGADVSSLGVFLSPTHLPLVSALRAYKQVPQVLRTGSFRGQSVNIDLCRIQGCRGRRLWCGHFIEPT